MWPCTCAACPIRLQISAPHTQKRWGPGAQGQQGQLKKSPLSSHPSSPARRPPERAPGARAGRGARHQTAPNFQSSTLEPPEGSAWQMGPRTSQGTHPSASSILAAAACRSFWGARRWRCGRPEGLAGAQAVRAILEAVSSSSSLSATTCWCLRRFWPTPCTWQIGATMQYIE